MMRFPKLLNDRPDPAELADIAIPLADEHPAEAEQIFNGRTPGRLAVPLITDELRFCRRLAHSDPARAGRVEASLSGPGARACAWAFVALGQAGRDRAGTCVRAGSP